MDRITKTGKTLMHWQRIGTTFANEYAFPAYNGLKLGSIKRFH